MSLAPPPYYFRRRGNGALVFRVSDTNRHARLEMEPIGTVNRKTGEVKPRGKRALTPEDRAAIADWLATEPSAPEPAARAALAMNRAAHWAQREATDEDLEAVTAELLMAMHDLRSVLIRRRGQSG